jgi:hypothetical protein
MNSNYDTSPRTIREGAERNKTHDGYLPYLNAPRGMGQGYSSGSWAEDDRRFLLTVKIALLAGLSGLICVITMMFI